ncbi:hypothetical protein [Pedobacter sp. L105]|uniref:hypothetical protein n=1 Tax=Pedobacter sp. L105 TaxID=1641871 RepID=UPI00131AD7A7|nr:hypothetical protein [Pedobacter sp. L105]
MKRIFIIVIFMFYGMLCKAQSVDSCRYQDSDIKVDKNLFRRKSPTQIILPDLKNKVSALPLNLTEKELEKIIQEHNQFPLITKGYKYNYKIDFGKKDVLKVEIQTKSSNQDGDEPYRSSIYETYISYICTDQKHDPKHNSSNLEMMKKIQAQKKCSGYSMIIYNTGDL